MRRLSKIWSRFVRRLDIFNVLCSLKENEVAVTFDPVVGRWFSRRGFWVRMIGDRLLERDAFLISDRESVRCCFGSRCGEDDKAVEA